MEVKFYSTKNNINVINKTKSNELVLNLNLRNDIDIIKPILIINGSGLDLDIFNYCEIPYLKRYYYFSDIEIIGNNLYRISLECDVLETYKHDILKSKTRYYRKIKHGDYIKTSIDFSNIKTIDSYKSSMSMPEGETMILTTIGS